MPPQLNILETAVLQMLLRGDEPVLESLRNQLRESTMTARRDTGAGFFTDFSVPDQVPRAPAKDSFVLGDVVGEIDGLENGAGFLLFIRNGKIAFLDGFSYNEPWPLSAAKFKVRYANGDERDFVGLIREWST